MAPLLSLAEGMPSTVICRPECSSQIAASYTTKFPHPLMHWGASRLAQAPGRVWSAL